MTQPPDCAVLPPADGRAFHDCERHNCRSILLHYPLRSSVASVRYQIAYCRKLPEGAPVAFDAEHDGVAV